jgi:hypothetical protein
MITKQDIKDADEAASVAHDFLWGRNEVTHKEANDAIWTIHNTLRDLLIEYGRNS